ncbi:MAG: hypothetical protein JSR44_09070 [Spirochaetes bacterium]|nr:hypothetical protein [Spirochaetota bacterium]
MQPLSRERMHECMRLCVWDYQYDADELIAIVRGEREARGMFTAEWIFQRMLECIDWYDILAMLTIERIKFLYTPALVKRIWPESRQENLEIRRKLLFKEPLPDAGWGDEARRARLKATVFSNRWNRIEQILLESSLQRRS